MVQIVREKMTRHDDARSLMRAIYKTEVDLEPDLQAKTLTDQNFIIPRLSPRPRCCA
jgi:hypothetical protein